MKIEGRANFGQAGANAFAILFRYALVLAYCFLLVLVYEIIHSWWDYFGFTYLLSDTNIAYASCFLVALPSLILPAHSRNFLHFGAYVLYILVFIPSMLVPVMQLSAGWDHAKILFLVTFSGTIIFLLLCRLPVYAFKAKPTNASVFWTIFWSLYGICTASVLLGYGQSLSFTGVGNEDVYAQRSIGGATGVNILVSYSLLFLANSLNPFLISYGLQYRRWLIVIGFAGQFLIFSALAYRFVLLIPFLAAGLYYLMNRRGHLSAITFFGSILLVALIFLPAMLNYDPTKGVFDNFLTLFYMRTLLISGMTFGVYDSFFTAFPNTYFAQSFPFSLFLTYPYGGLSVGQVVGQYIAPSRGAEVLELNANFLATDAIASLGVWAVPIISTFAAVVLWTMARFVPVGKERLAAVATLGFFISISNTSLLTALISGGGIILMALIYFAPTPVYDQTPQPMKRH